MNTHSRASERKINLLSLISRDGRVGLEMRAMGKGGNI